MGRRGPPPKPTQTREREGNPRRRPLPKNEPKPPAAKDIPPPPKHLDDLAKRTWRHLAQILTEADMLTVADTQPLEMLCDQYSQWVKALDLRREHGAIMEIEKDGEIVARYESPESKLCRSLANDCNKWFKVLGLGPAYRVGLTTTSAQGDEIEDPLAASIANG